jgi:thiosulfate dehydrogenase [quinone] large subunit
VAESPERRALLQAALLAGVSAIVASFALPLRALGVATGHGSTAAATPPPGNSAPSPITAVGSPSTTSATPAPAATAPAGTAVASVSDVKRAGAAAFQIPFDAPSPLPAGDPGVIVQLANGSFVAFDAVCTHAGCTVEYDRPDRLLVCPCHSAVYDPAHDAEVLGGPTQTPLTKVPIVVDLSA